MDKDVPGATRRYRHIVRATMPEVSTSPSNSRAATILYLPYYVGNQAAHHLIIPDECAPARRLSLRVGVAHLRIRS